MAKKTAPAGKALTEPVYYITNQFNLREILSGGFIGSRASFDDKYYKDLLEECPGRIPLFTEAPAASLRQKVNEHNPEISFAVILQIDAAKLNMDTSARIKEGEKIVCIACEGAIPLDSVSAIHFLSVQNRSEFEVRTYSNMPNPRELYRVTPELAQMTDRNPDVLARLRELPPLPYPTRDQFSSIDRVSGAISLCIFRSAGKEQSGQLLKLLEKGKKQKKTDQIPSWFKPGLEKQLPDEISSLTNINELVFASTITVLHDHNLNTIGQKPVVLEEIRKQVFANPAIGERKATLEKSFTKIQRILRLEDDFEPLKPSPGYDALQALLLFLMRPNHNALLSWPASETNASQPVMLTALAYSGIVIGRKGLETEYRQADAKVAALVADVLNVISKQNGKPAKTDTKPSKPKATKTQLILSTETSGIPVPAQRVLPSSIDWKTISEETLTEKKDDQELVGSAVWLCQEKGWGDCISTVVTWPHKEKFRIQSEKTRLTLKFSGFPKISYELNLEQFRLKLFGPMQDRTAGNH